MEQRRRKENRQRVLAIVVNRFLVQVHRTLQGCAARLQAWASRYSRRTQIRVLVLFCMLSLSADVAVIIQNLKKAEGPSIAISAIQVLPLQPHDAVQPIPPANVLARIHRFKRYIDSVGHNVSTDRAIDSLLQARPRLLDSLRSLERNYVELQNNNHGK